jgi:hypothetical protein
MAPQRNRRSTLTAQRDALSKRPARVRGALETGTGLRLREERHDTQEGTGDGALPTRVRRAVLGVERQRRAAYSSEVQQRQRPRPPPDDPARPTDLVTDARRPRRVKFGTKRPYRRPR